MNEGGLAVIESVARAYFQALNDNDPARAAACFAQDGVIRSMSRTLLPPAIAGRQAIAEAISMIVDAFPQGLEMTVHSMTAQDNRVAVEVESAGRHHSGKAYNNRYVFLMIFEGDRITEMREYLDSEHVTDVIFDGARRQDDASSA